MASQTTIHEDLLRGEAFFSDLMDRKRSEAIDGAKICNDNSFILTHIITALKFKDDAGEYDKVADRLHNCLIKILGEYEIPVYSPVITVYPSSNTIQLPDNEAVFTAEIMPGTNPIATIQWTQTAGEQAVLSGEDTNQLTVSGLTAGNYSFRITATDTKGVVAFKEATLNVKQALLTAFFGWKDTRDALTQGEIVDSIHTKGFETMANYTLDFSPNIALKYLWFAEPANEPVKTKWEDIFIYYNNGKIGSSQDLFGEPVLVGSFRFYITEYKTKAPNPLRFKVS